MESGEQQAVVITADPAVSARVVAALERGGYRVHALTDGGPVERGEITAELVVVELEHLAIVTSVPTWCERAEREPAVVVLARDAADGEAAYAAGALDVWWRAASAVELDLRLLALGRQLGARRAGRMLLESVPALVAQLDRDGVVRYISGHWSRAVAGFQLGRAGIEQIAPEHRARVLDAFAAAGRTGEIQRVEATSVFGITYDSRLVPVRAHGRFEGIVLIANDITERRWAEAEQRTLTSKAAGLLRALPDLVFWMRGDGTLLDYYAGDPSKLLVAPERIVGARMQDLVPPQLGAMFVEAIGLATSTGRIQLMHYQVPVEDRSADFEARIVASGDEQIVCVVRDVTERTRMQAQLAISDRLAALGTLAAGVAHEINNPLTYILIGVESVTKELRRLRAEGSLGERGQVLVGRLESALEGARRVRRIVSDLKSFARAEGSDAGPVDVREILDGVAALVDGQVRHRGRLIKEFAEVPRVSASGDRLNQVFLNLLINALHALPEGHPGDNEIRIGVAPADDGKVRVEISDTGHGIAPEDLGRIFDPFYTTKPVGIGTGLGLWICHSIIANLGGAIAVESQLGRGTTFRIALPAAEPDAAVAAPPADEPITWNAGRILIIDDDDEVAAAVGLLFDGCEVVTVRSGEAALAALAHGEFDWIFCDLLMPDVSGMDVYHRLREERPGVEERVVFMTGGAFTPRARAFVDRLANPVLQKPFGAPELAAALRLRNRALRARRPTPRPAR
jgi:signal transduction histidine kinase/ActR/RegA family two-component response regulator